VIPRPGIAYPPPALPMLAPRLLPALLLGAALLAPAPALAAGPAASQPSAPPPPAGPDPNTIVLATGAALAGAALVAGVVFTGLWASKGAAATSDDARVPKNAPCPPGGVGVTGNCADLVSALNAQATFGTAAVGTFVAAGGVGIVTLISALMSPHAPPPPVAPVMVGHGGGLAIVGSF
jgi:hypothetical protein